MMTNKTFIYTCNLMISSIILITKNQRRNLLIYPWQQEDKWSILIKNNIISQHFYSLFLSLSPSPSPLLSSSLVFLRAVCRTSSSFLLFFLCLFGLNTERRRRRRRRKRRRRGTSANRFSFSLSLFEHFLLSRKSLHWIDRKRRARQL